MIKKIGSGIGRVLLCGAVAAMLSSAAVAKEKLPEVDKDGLHLVKDSKVAVAYLKPGADLGQYDKIKLLDCYVDFVKDWEKNYNMNEIGLEGRVRDKDAEEIKKRLSDEFRAVFTKELTKKGYPIVEDIGPSVLLLRPALINVDVAAPDLRNNTARNYTLVQSAGGMTLYLELYDSATSTLLARIADPKADDTGFAERANRVTNKAAADRILRSWADQLAKHLTDITQQKK